MVSGMTDCMSIFSSFGAITKPACFLKVDPVLTEAISEEDEEEISESLMDHIKQEYDGASFDFQPQLHAWSGALSPPSSSFHVPRLTRFCPNEFREHDDLNSTFGETLETPDFTGASMPCLFNNGSMMSQPANSRAVSLSSLIEHPWAMNSCMHQASDIAETEDSFDKSVESLNQTPCGRKSEGFPPYFKKGNCNENSSTIRRSDSINCGSNGHLMEVRRLRTMEFASKTCNSIPISIDSTAHHNMLGCAIREMPIDMPSPEAQHIFTRQKNLDDCLFRSPSLRTTSHSFDKTHTHLYALGSCSHRPHNKQMHEHVPHESSEKLSEGNAMNIFSHMRKFSQRPHKYASYQTAPSPISHRIINKRVAQIEASEYINLSNSGRCGETLNDAYGMELDGLDDLKYGNENEFVYPYGRFNRVSGRHRSLHGMTRAHNKPFSGPYNRRAPAFAPTSPASATERTRKTYVSRNGGRKRNLLNFILELLTTRQTCVEWVDKPKQVFQIVNPEQLTKLWGEHKNNVKMSFESLSRSLRLYYKPGKLERIPGMRHQYRLVKFPIESPVSDPDNLHSIRDCTTDPRSSDSPPFHNHSHATPPRSSFSSKGFQ